MYYLCVTGKGSITLLNEMCSKLEDSVLGKLLMDADPSGNANLERLYLHDFVRSTYKCTRRKQELRIMEYEVRSNCVKKTLWFYYDR